MRPTQLLALLLIAVPARAFRPSSSFSRPATVRLSPNAAASRAAPIKLAALGSELPELPTPKLLKAVGDCGSTATAADVAAASGLSVEETRRQLLNLARLVGAELQVSEDGELLFVFDEPGALKRSLRTSSVRQRAKDTWVKVNPPLFWLLRASFGLGLLASLTLVLGIGWLACAGPPEPPVRPEREPLTARLSQVANSQIEEKADGPWVVRTRRAGRGPSACAGPDGRRCHTPPPGPHCRGVGRPRERKTD